MKERLTVQNLGINTILKDDPSKNGDTLFAKLTDTIKKDYSAYVFSSDIDNSWHTGSILLSRFDRLKSILPKKSGLIYPKLDKKTNIPVEKILSWRDTLKPGLFQLVEFGETAEKLIAKVKNNSTSVNLNDIQYKIISKYDTVKFNAIDALSAGDSVIVSALLSGIKIGQELIVECQALPGISEITENCSGLLSFETDFNGLHFSKAIISDSLVGMEVGYKIRYPVGCKGTKALFVDISKFNMPVIVRNTLPLSMKVTARINNIWDKDYCNANKIESCNDLYYMKPDSLFFKGNEIASVNVPAFTDINSEELSKCDISIENARILPDWDPKDSINVLDIVLNGRIEYSGKLIEIDNALNTGIRFKDPQMEISSILGLYSENKIIRSDPVKVPILSTVPSADMLTNLKNRLLPAKTDVNLNVAFRIPDNTSFEDVDIKCLLFENNPGQVLDSLKFRVSDIRKGKKFSYNCSFDRIAEKLPDSIGYYLTYNIEAGKKIYLDKKVLNTEYGMVMAEFDVDAILDMKMNLVWSVVDTVNINFSRKIASFPISSKNIDLMENKEMELYATVSNNSNIVGRLSAVIESDSEDIYGKKTTKIQLLGKEGILLPERGNTSDNRIAFNQDEIREIAKPESLDVKWNLELYPTGVDALRDSDYVDVDAEIVFKGEETTESMFGK